MVSGDDTSVVVAIFSEAVVVTATEVRSEVSDCCIGVAVVSVSG